MLSLPQAPTPTSLIPTPQQVHFWRKLRLNSCILWPGLQGEAAPVSGLLTGARWDVVSEALSVPAVGTEEQTPGSAPLMNHSSHLKDINAQIALKTG